MRGTKPLQQSGVAAENGGSIKVTLAKLEVSLRTP